MFAHRSPTPVAAVSPSRLALLVAVGLSIFATDARAIDWPAVNSDLPAANIGGNDAAVVVGINEYFVLPKVPGADQNALDWMRYLVKTRGIPQKHVALLTNGQATKESIRTAVATAATQVQPGGTLWFIYIGHGAPAPSHDDGLLLGADTQAEENSLVARGLPQKEVLQLMETSGGEAGIAIFDACFSGTTGDGTTQLVPGSQATVPVKRREAAAGRVGILSASDQVAGPLPGHNRPAFTYLLLGAARGWADANKDKTVSFTEAFDYTREVLVTMVRSRSQIPSMRGQKTITFATGVAEKGPDLVNMVEAIAPATVKYRSSNLVAPTHDAAVFSGTGFSANMDLEVEKLREDVLDVAESKVATAVSKRDAWCKLSKQGGLNPYKEDAGQLCASWGKYVEDEAKLASNMTADFGTLAGYLDLRRRTPENKIAATEDFIKVYEKYGDRQEVIAAKVALSNLKDGKPHGIAPDTDADGLIIDACPNEAEDFDGDADDDGCPETGALEATGDAIGGAVDAIDDAGFHLHLLNFSYFRLEMGGVVGFGLWDQAEFIPTKPDQIAFRPVVGLTLRGILGPIEAGVEGDWDLSRDLEDGGGYLAAHAGLRPFGIGPWTPSIGVDYRNIFNLAPADPSFGFYLANTFSVFEVLHLRLTYRFGIDPPGAVVPVHALFVETTVPLADPSGSVLDLLGECVDDDDCFSVVAGVGAAVVVLGGLVFLLGAIDD